MGTWELTSALSPTCPCPRGYSSFLLGLQADHVAQRWASSVSGPGGELAQPRAHSPPGTRTKSSWSWEEATAPRWGWGAGEADPTTPPAPLWSPPCQPAATPCLHFHPTSPGDLLGPAARPGWHRRALLSPLDPHSNVGPAPSPPPRGQDREGRRPPREGLTALLRPAQCPVTSVLCL